MILLEPIAFVKNKIKNSFEGPWGDIESEIILAENFDKSVFIGLSEFSHLEILFYFDKLNKENICNATRRPKDNPAWPVTGIFAQRGSGRPNLIGATYVKLLAVLDDRIRVQGLDAFDGTPVLDIKPVMQEFLPHEAIIQPKWSTDLMKNYF